METGGWIGGQYPMTIRFGVLTVSDRSARGDRPDTSGPALGDEIRRLGWEVIKKAIVPDDYDVLVNHLQEWSRDGEIDVLLTTGGTGFSPRDITPEATQTVVQRPAPGIAEAMRIESMKITPHAMLSRAIAGIRDATLIINLPGSPKGAVENFKVIQVVIPHAVALLQDDASAEAGHRLK